MDIQPRAVALTFDDAYENFYEYAFPILQQHGFTATVYAIAGMLGQSADWLIADGHAAPPLMTASRLRELQAAKIEIGSHSFSPIRLAAQSDRKSVVSGQSVAVRVDLGGRRSIYTNKQIQETRHNNVDV